MKAAATNSNFDFLISLKLDVIDLEIPTYARSNGHRLKTSKVGKIKYQIYQF